MSRRTWISVLAIVSLLVHATALARHNAIMLLRSVMTATGGAATSEDRFREARAEWVAAGLPADGFVICHGGADAGTPATPDPTSNCPLCGGLTTAFVVCPAINTLVSQRVANAVEGAVAPERPATEVRFTRPPSRGPPIGRT